jgi:hypothetical protein
MLEEGDPTASTLAIALDIAEELARRLPTRGGGGFRVAIAGGVALQMSLKGALQVGSDATEVLSVLLGTAPPADTVIAPRGYRAAVVDRTDVSFGEGPCVNGIDTIIIAPKRGGARVSMPFDQPLPAGADMHAAGLSTIVEAETAWAE